MEQGSAVGEAGLGSSTPVIHLDTNYLIGSLDRLSPPAAILKNWLESGETFAASSVAWAEFLHGPVRPDQVRLVAHLIQGRVIPFGRSEADISSRLFNGGGRKRGSLPDCFIAATAICAKASLATLNRKHFAPFLTSGLRLA